MELVTLPGGATIRTMVTPSGNATVHVDRGGYVEPPTPAQRNGATRFYIPFTKVHPATVAGAPPHAVWVDVSSSPDAYYGALYGWWAQAETFAIIEHDVVCRPGIIKGFDDCPEPWCVHGYDPPCSCGRIECREAWANMLGCTRFRRELIETVPDALSSIPLDGWDWHNVCDRIGERLRDGGYSHHWHEPGVRHIPHGDESWRTA